MQKMFFVLLVITVLSCSKVVSTGSMNSKVQQQIERIEKYENVFLRLDSLLDLDDGEFWNHKLQGPLLLVNPRTREFFANQNNTKNEFQELGRIYSDSLPKNINIANTAIDWDGKRWTMVMTPLPSNELMANNLLVHESFHRIQPYIGFDELSAPNNAHLEKLEGRFLLRLELQALYECLNASSSKKKKQHLKSALIFRIERQKNTVHKSNENLLELNEGLAEYTGMMLSGMNDEQKSKSLKSKLEKYMSGKSFTLSFAYHTIPIYGYFASKLQPRWHQNIRGDSQLTESLLEVLNIDVNVGYKSLLKHNSYNHKIILNQEKKREELRLERIAEYKKRFLGKDVVKLFFRQMNIRFNPNNLFQIDSLGTVYNGLRVTDQWGILEVEKEGLIDPQWSHVTITKPLKFHGHIIHGEGWKLTMKKGWKVKRRKNMYVLSQE